MLVLLVALRKESVDRNSLSGAGSPSTLGSLSARRAWIEITRQTYQPNAKQVALRKESVDRNIACVSCVKLTVLSLSARRAWIEILPARHA